MPDDRVKPPEKPPAPRITASDPGRVREPSRTLREAPPSEDPSDGPGGDEVAETADKELGLTD